MAEKRLSGTKVLMVIAPEEFRDEELLTPKSILTDAGCAVVVASTRLGEAKGMLGATVNPDTLISDSKAQDYDAVIVVGGMGSPAFLWDEVKLHSLLKNAIDSGKVVAAICLSGAVLAKAGLLSGKRATVWESPESLQALSEGKAKYVKEPVVQDGKLITADGPQSAEQFAQAIVAELSRVKV